MKMKVRLLAPDSVIPNMAIMKISSYYKKLGHDVGWYDPEKDLFDTDKLFISKVFKFSKFDYSIPMNPYCEIEYGGTGYDIEKKLPQEIEGITDLDWSLYPDCDYSIIFTTRGCIRKCQFCLVNEKEGIIHDVEFTRLNPKGKEIRVMDNNFFASKSWVERLNKLKKLNKPLDFSGGVDLRILTEEMCMELNKCRIKSIKVAWDNYKDINIILSKIDMLTKYIIPYKIVCYVLVGFNSKKLLNEDIERVKTLWDRKVYPFVMVYQDFNNPKYKKPQELKDFARWCNNRFIFKKCSWEEYEHNKKGIKNE